MYISHWHQIDQHHPQQALAFNNHTRGRRSEELDPTPQTSEKRLPPKSCLFDGLLVLLCMLLPTQASAFLYPYDFGSYADQPRGMVNNAALLHFCDRAAAFSGRLRSNKFQPVRGDTAGTGTEPTDGNAIEAEAGLCHHELEWLTLGLFAAFSSFDSALSTQSENNPIVFPLQKTYLPVLSSAYSLTLIDNVHVGFAAQFFETIEIDAQIAVAEELRATIDTRIAITFNWNIGMAVETTMGILHAGYQPAFEADINFELSAPIDFSALNLNIQLDDFFSLDGALDYRPATWQVGWIGEFGAIQMELGALISEWDRLGAGTFITFSDRLGISQFLFTVDDIILHKTVDPYLHMTLSVDDSLSVHGGYAFFQSPIVAEDTSRWAVGGDIHSLKGGIQLKSYFRGKPVYFEGQLIYGYMPDQPVSGGMSVSGKYIAGMGQISFPF